MRKEKKYPFGLVSVFLQVEDGRIENVKFYGDFFGAEDIEELEEMLYHVYLDDNLIDVCRQIETDRFISGLSPEDLYDLLRY